MSLSYNDLKPCNLSSVEMSSLDPSVIVVPCIAWDVGPYNNTNDNDSMSNVSISSPLITVIQVTPPQCSNHRDGAPTAVELLNSQNNGRGPAIGSKKDHYVQFRFVAVVAGSIADADNNDQEGQDHKTILKSMIDTLNPHYIMGTCTFVAAHERQIALEYKRILVAQAISDLAHKYGFNDTVDYKFDPFADDNNNTVVNSMDADYLIDLADSVCGPGSLTDVFPAIFMCTSGSEDVLLNRWRENGCRPVSLWMTQATQTWATDNPDAVPYIQGAAQWHPSFSYVDDFFQSGTDFLNQQEQKLGYRGTYDMLISYSIMTLFSKHIQWFNRNVDTPTVDEDFASETGYENLRSNMTVLKVDTLFGPFYIPANQMQNSGRDPAGTQWLPDAQLNNSIQNKCTSPSSEADSTIVIPSPALETCEAGASVSLEAVQDEPSLLISKCVACDVDTYSPSNGSSCLPCPEGSSTNQDTGATACVVTDDNILSRALLSMAFMFACITWSVGLSMLAWILRHKDDQIVKTSRTYMFLMTGGAMLSTTSLMTMSFDAGTGSSSTLATVGCQITPFLYTIGWGLQLGSVAGLAYPVSRRAWNPHIHSYVEPRSAWPLYMTVSFNTLVCILWTLLSPREYSRWTVSEVVDPNTGMITIDTVGFCTATGHVPFWVFVGSLALCHATLLIRIVVLYTTNRTREDKFGQRRSCFFAALYAAVLLLIGVPLVAAVSEEYAKGLQLSKREKKKKKKEQADAVQKAMERERKMAAFQNSQFNRGFDSLDLQDLSSNLGHDSDEREGTISHTIGRYDVTS
ncbi:hypothetical protein MHU86_22991 [Fragilaria crotonensis]|nr:hypothetical protein MHU86_22991 [Fragilaria crotonensis]